MKDLGKSTTFSGEHAARYAHGSTNRPPGLRTEYLNSNTIDVLHPTDSYVLLVYISFPVPRKHPVYIPAPPFPKLFPLTPRLQQYLHIQQHVQFQIYPVGQVRAATRISTATAAVSLVYSCARKSTPQVEQLPASLLRYT